MNRFNRKLGLEGLETRCLLAGNVFVRVIDGDLRIVGDEASNVAKSNSISLVQIGVGSYRVTGLSSAGQLTKINNGLDPVVVRNVTDDVICNLYSGNDRIQIGNNARDTAFPDDITINGGIGSDTVIARRVKGDQVTINLGVATESNIDVVKAYDSHFRGSASIALGGGNDYLESVGSEVDGELKITLNAGDDRAIINGGFAGSVNLQCGGGNDFGRFSGVLEVEGNVLADGGEGIDEGVIDPDADLTVGGSTQFSNFEAGS